LDPNRSRLPASTGSRRAVSVLGDIISAEMNSARRLLLESSDRRFRRIPAALSSYESRKLPNHLVEDAMTTILLIVVLVMFLGGGGYYGYRRW
jgi:hypothetical protein